MNAAVACPSLLQRIVGGGSGTGITVDPRPEMGGGSKAGSAAQAAGGFWANFCGAPIYLKASAFTKVQAKYLILRSRGIHHNFLCLLLTQVSVVEQLRSLLFFCL